MNFPLALTLTHYGASEVFLDGNKIDSFGVIVDKEHTINLDPQDVPFPITLTQPGAHVIAIRYANFDAQRNAKLYSDDFAGFRMAIGGSRYFFLRHHRVDITLTFVFSLMFGIFIALALSHLFLFLYYRTSRANIYFSTFCFTMAFVFLVSFLNWTSHSPLVELNNRFIAMVIFSAACFSYSGLTNVLFSVKKLRFKIFSAVCVLAVIARVISPLIGFLFYLAMTAFVSVEAIVLTVSAIHRKVKGARIIGVGVLFFALFICVNIIMSIVLQADLFNDSTVVGQVNLFIAALAILSIPISMSSYLAWSFASVNKDLTKNLQHVELLSQQALEQEQEKKRMLETQNERLEQEVAARTSEVVAQKDKIEKQHSELKAEKKKSDDLLRNILPEEVAEELKQKGRSEAKFFNDVTVLFTDFVDFTKVAERMEPQQLVDELDACFKAFDDIISKYGIEKIKTIGDAYLAVCGLPLPDSVHAEKVATASLEIAQFMMLRKQQLGAKTFEVRIGIHSGNLVAGIVGVKKFAYDIWGDTVNTAARMEQNSLPGKINASQATYDLIKDKFDCTYRGEITAKNKGELKMYFVETRL